MDDRRTVVPAAVGGAVATASIVLLDAPLASRIFLLAPLVVVPALAPLHHAVSPRRVRTVAWATLAAAVPLAVAFALPAGPAAAVLSAPWLLAAAALALLAVRDGLPRLRDIAFGPDRDRSQRAFAALTADAALGFLAVGAVFATSDRAGVAPLGFDPMIIVLTAVHFHFAGLGLVLASSHVAIARPSRLATVAAVVLAAGMPITALGFTTGSDGVGALGAAVVVAGAVLTAIALVRWRRSLVVAAACLFVGVPFGLAWAIASWLDIRWIGLDAMVVVHGTLNAAGVVLAALLIARDPGSRVPGGPTPPRPTAVRAGG